MLVVHPSTPIHSIKELIAYAKANPGKLHYGTSGNGSASHLGGEKFKMLTGTDMVHVPYKGAGPALNDGIAGVYQVSLWTPLASAPYVKSGKLRALAVTSPKRTQTRCPTCRLSPKPDCRNMSTGRGSACTRRQARRSRSSTSSRQ